MSGRGCPFGSWACAPASNGIVCTSAEMQTIGMSSHRIPHSVLKDIEIGVAGLSRLSRITVQGSGLMNKSEGIENITEMENSVSVDTHSY